MPTTYHVRIVTETGGTFYIGDMLGQVENAPVSDVENAHIYSKAGALNKAEQTRTFNAEKGLRSTVDAIMLSRTGKVTRVLGNQR